MCDFSLVLTIEGWDSSPGDDPPRTPPEAPSWAARPAGDARHSETAKALLRIRDWSSVDTLGISWDFFDPILGDKALFLMGCQKLKAD